MIGYAAYVLLLILPGLAVGLATRVLVKKRFVEVLAVSFGLSLIFSPILLLLGYTFLHAVTWELVYGILAGALVSSVILAFWQKLRVAMPSINKVELAALVLIPVQGALLWLQFSAFPIFPESISGDFRYHLQIALQFHSGTLPVSQITYPPGIQFFVASLLSVENEVPLVLMQQALALMAALAPLLVFAVVSRILKDQRLGLAASLIYVFTGIIWSDALYGSGLYANFLANLVTLAVIYLLVEGLEGLDWGRRLLVVAGGVALYLSHYTVIVFVVALWVMLPVIWLRARDRLFRYLQMAGIITAPGVVIAVAYPDVVATILQIPGYAGGIAGLAGGAPDSLGAFLIPISPFIGDLYLEIGIGLFVFALVALILALRESTKKVEIWIPFILAWFLLTWVVTPYGEIAWRFSELGEVPLLFLLPVALGTILPPTEARAVGGRDLVRRKKIRDRSAGTLRWGFFVVLALIILAKAPLAAEVQGISAQGNTGAQNQQQVYDAMDWLATHSAPRSNVLGLEDWRFSYLGVLWDYRVTLYAYVNATDADSLVNKSGYGYLMVSNYLIPGPDSTVQGTNPNFQGFMNYSRFELLYSNPSVAVFSVKNATT